jgi:hypothetical protein
MDNYGTIRDSASEASRIASRRQTCPNEGKDGMTGSEHGPFYPRDTRSEKEALFLAMYDGEFRPILWAGGSTGVSPHLEMLIVIGGLFYKSIWKNKKNPTTLN